MSIFEIIIGAVFLFAVGISLGIAIERMISNRHIVRIDLNRWERMEGWRK